MFEKSKWIWLNASAKHDEYADFKLNFNARTGKKYVLNLSCDSDYALYKDGSLLNFGQYGDYPDYKIYDSLDLSDFVTDGANEFIITVWYKGVDTQTYINKGAGLIFELYENDEPVLFSSENILSRTSAGYVPHCCDSVTSQLGISFTYDCNRSAGDFSKSKVVDYLTKTLHPRPINKLVLADGFDLSVVQSGGFTFYGGITAGERMSLAALSNRKKNGRESDMPNNYLTALDGEDGVYLIADMGRETAGLPEFDIETDDNCEVLIGWGEHLADGRCRTSVGGRNFSCRFYAKRGVNHYLNPFLRMGARYLQIFIVTKSAKVNSLTLRETYYPLNVKPYNGNNVLRQKIYDICVNTLRQCMHEHYEDCPWREQALYTMDSRNQMLCGYYAFGEKQFAKAALELISHGRRPDGLLSLCFPAGCDLPIPFFSLMYIIQLREYSDYASDTDFIKSKYSFITDLLAVFAEKRRDDGLILNFYGKDYWNFYEWSEGMTGFEWSDESKSYEYYNKPYCEAPLNAFYSLALQNMASIAEKLGNDSDRERYLVESEKVNKELVNNFYDKNTGLFRSFDNRRFDEYSVLTNSLCLLCGAADGLDKSNICTLLESNGAGAVGIKAVPSTLSMNCFRFDALLRDDKSKYSNVVLDEIDRTYFKMLCEGATSFWETAEGIDDFDGGASLCHGWSALPVYYYSVLEKN